MRRALLAAAWLAAGVLAAGCGRHARVDAVAARDGGTLRLSPEPAFAGAALAASLDAPGVDPARCDFVWRRNGRVVPGASGPVLEPDNFARGDEVALVVTAPGPAGAARAWGAGVRVENSPPRVTRVTLGVSTAPGAAVVEANVEAADADHDPLAFHFRWFRNGDVVAGADGASLPLSVTGRGDRVAVEVAADDGTVRSPAVRSEALAVDDRPPAFTSSPPPLAADAVAFEYQAAAADPDGDPLHYELAAGPEGMTVAPDGRVAWRLPAGAARAGDVRVSLRALDGRGGEARQEFTLRLAPPPAPRR